MKSKTAVVPVVFPESKNPGVATLYPDKGRQPVSFKANDAVRAKLKKMSKRLKKRGVSMSDGICLLIDKHGDTIEP